MANDTQNEGQPLSRKTAITVAAAMLAVPALYVALAHNPKVQANPVAPAAAPASNTAALEQVEGATPSAENKLNLSLAYINGNAPSRAVPLLKAVLADDPKNARAWNNLCVAYMSLQEFNHAIGACEAGARADSTMQLLQNNLRWAKDEAAKAEGAVAGETRKPRDQRTPDSYMLEGMNRLHLGQYTEAQQAWYQCLALDPHNALAQNNIGVAYMMLNKPTDAAQAFTKAITLDGANQLFKNNLNWAQTTK